MTSNTEATALRNAAALFRTPTIAMSALQLASGFVPLITIFVVMYTALAYGITYWLISPLSLLAALFIVRIFIFQHDCGHGSFFRSRSANRWIGMMCSLVTVTPFENWRRQHAGHHMHWNNLDNRHSGADIYSTVLTIEEYRAMPWYQQMFYRFVWHPIVGLLLIPPIVFLLLYRIPLDSPKNWIKERRNVYVTNVALACVYGALIWAFGWKSVLLVHAPAIALAAIIGVWMFSLQHRFEGAAWVGEDVWTSEVASLTGTSHLVLPKILQWFTGNIGFHHIHHLDPAVPNYRLEACHKSDQRFAVAPTLTLWQGLSAMRYCLWDSQQQRLVRMPK